MSAEFSSIEMWLRPRCVPSVLICLRVPLIQLLDLIESQLLKWSHLVCGLASERSIEDVLVSLVTVNV